MLDVDELICRSLKGLTTDAEEKRLGAWRQADPANDAQYRDLVRVLEIAESAALDQAPPPPPRLTSLIPRTDRPGVPPSWRRFRSGAFAWGGGIALAAAAVLLWVVGIDRPGVEQTAEFAFGAGEFVTGPEETATVVLSDGTVVRLASDSRLRIPGVPGSREVLLDGTAFFAVANMEGYPFRVRTQAGEAKVLGTRFEIRTRGEDLRLVVMEGRVALGTGANPVEVGAGEVSVVSNGTTSAPTAVADVRPLVPWLERFIVFQSTPLEEVAAELEEEYGVEVEVVDRTLASQTVTGWYADRSLAEVLTIVCGVLQARCSVDDGVARIGTE